MSKNKSTTISTKSINTEPKKIGRPRKAEPAKAKKISIPTPTKDRNVIVAPSMTTKSGVNAEELNKKLENALKKVAELRKQSEQSKDFSFLEGKILKQTKTKNNGVIIDFYFIKKVGPAVCESDCDGYRVPVVAENIFISYDYNALGKPIRSDVAKYSWDDTDGVSVFLETKENPNTILVSEDDVKAEIKNVAKIAAKIAKIKFPKI